MTLARLVLAWLPLGAWFIAAGWAGRRLLGVPVPAPGAERWRAVGWTLGEAAVVTLFASLWFDSLGAGGWWLLFLLVGLLAAFPARLPALAARTLSRAEIWLALLDTVRYLGAGALLAWRLR